MKKIKHLRHGFILFLVVLKKFFVRLISEIPVLNSLERKRRQNQKNVLMHLFLKPKTSQKDKTKITEELLEMDFFQMKEDEWEVMYLLSREGEPKEKREIAKKRMIEINQHEEGIVYSVSKS